MRNNAGMTHAFEAAVAASAEHIRDLCAGQVPELALLLGTGWQAVADLVDTRACSTYAELPAFPRLGVDGHAGRVQVGSLGDRQVLVLSGREHAYEHGRVDAMRGVIQTLAVLGIKALVQTNAAGSLSASMTPGSIMLIEDHLNLVQASPLVGLADNRRFVHMANAYDADLRAQARRAAANAGLTLHEGVYAWMLGPQFETPAEIRMLQGLGAQAVGMSTVPETLLARHAGLRVLGLSILTNMGCGLSDEALSHAHTLARAEAAADVASRLIQAVVPALAI